MQTKQLNQPTSKRQFVVGIVGANAHEFESISRIFTVTNFRCRSYSAKHIDIGAHKHPHNVDFIVMCSNNPRAISVWNNSSYTMTNNKQPMIFLSRHKDQKLGRYQIASPINASRLIKLLDHFTISELNYFPEFEIGGDSSNIEDIMVSGLRILRKNAIRNPKTSDARKSVLVIDDSLAVRRQMQIEIQLLNDRLDVADCAEAAIKAIDKKRYDLIFLDVVMPGMDGYAVCKKIKKSPLNRNTPVVMLTSRSSSFDKIKGALAGCDAYLVKPINHNDFESICNRFTHDKLERDQAYAS
ncbi:MAG: two-component system cell cycle response regulator [Lentisphaeria bacterium]|jgi:two-component system cell cycle response regulator